MDQEPVVDENEQLRRVEAKLAAIRRENARLEFRLTRTSEVRRFAMLGVALAITVAGASYWTALHGCERRAVHASEQQAQLREERMADERAVVEACFETSKKASADLAQCQEQRTRADMNDRFRMHAPPPTF